MAAKENAASENEENGSEERNQREAKINRQRNMKKGEEENQISKKWRQSAASKKERKLSASKRYNQRNKKKQKMKSESIKAAENGVNIERKMTKKNIGMAAASYSIIINGIEKWHERINEMKWLSSGSASHRSAEKKKNSGIMIIAASAKSNQSGVRMKAATQRARRNLAKSTAKAYQRRHQILASAHENSGVGKRRRGEQWLVNASISASNVNMKNNITLIKYHSMRRIASYKHANGMRHSAHARGISGNNQA